MLIDKFNSRAEIINNCIDDNNKSYLEIGIMSGGTFSKIKYKKKNRRRS